MGLLTGLRRAIFTNFLKVVFWVRFREEHVIMLYILVIILIVTREKDGTPPLYRPWFDPIKMIK